MPAGCKGRSISICKSCAACSYGSWFSQALATTARRRITRLQRSTVPPCKTLGTTSASVGCTPMSIWQVAQAGSCHTCSRHVVNRRCSTGTCRCQLPWSFLSKATCTLSCCSRCTHMCLHAHADESALHSDGGHCMSLSITAAAATSTDQQTCHCLSTGCWLLRMICGRGAADEQLGNFDWFA